MIDYFRKIHPCGYWNYVQHQIYEHIVGRTVKHGNLKSFANPSSKFDMIQLEILDYFKSFKIFYF